MVKLRPLAVLLGLLAGTAANAADLDVQLRTANGAPVRDAGALRVDVDGGLGDQVAGPIARDIPIDPSSSQDVVLRVGYQMLKSQVGQRTPLRGK